ncbi:MAG: SurA N-terminal domain-containing protein [Thermodesulfobacteriota bacterium]
MLDVLRRNARSWAIKLILGFIALTFIWWGVGSYDAENRDVAATVGEERVTFAEMAETASTLEKAYRDALGSAFTPEMARDVRQQAIDLLVRRRIMMAEAAALGISATDDEVQREIAATPAFQANGQFREDRYRQVLAASRLTPGAYEASTRSAITLRKLEGLLAAGVLIPETEAKELFLLTTREIRVLVATADPEKLKNVAPPSDGEIAAKYEQSRESFRIPARVKLAVAAFTPDRFAGDVRPTEEEVKAYYEDNADRFRTEESRLVSKIVFPYVGKNKEEVAGKAAGSLAEAMKDKRRFGAETWVTRKDAGPGLSEAVFGAPVDTVIGPVDVGTAFVIARVNRIRFPETLPLSEVRGRVVEEISREKGKDLATVKAYEAHPKAAAAGDVVKTASAYGVKAVETGWIGAEGAAGIPSAVAQDALLLAAGEVAPVKTIGDTHFLYQVAAKEDSRIPPLQEVRARVAAAAAREKRVAAARAALLQALSASKTAAEFEANAKKAGIPVAPTGWFAPLADTIPGGMAQEGDVRKDLSILSNKAPVSSKIYPGPEGRSLGVAFLEERIAGAAEWAERKDEFLQGMRRQGETTLRDQFLADRRKELKVEINPEALK